MSLEEASFAATIAHHSKSFALAAKLLPAGVREEALVLYAWCRRADDAVDLCAPAEQPAALAGLRSELDAVYGPGTPQDPVARAFAAVVRARGIDRQIPQDLVAGMEMDAVGTRYRTFAELERYCYCVAGTVGLMMCHAMGVRDPRALQHAADLGIAMQLTNICRDVLEDWERSRLYLPGELLRAHGADGLLALTGAPLPREHGPALRAAIGELLVRADRYYASGDAGLRYLSPRCRLSIRTARLVYSRIGHGLRERGCDPWLGRVVVPRSRKIALALQAAIETLGGARWPQPSA